MENMAAVAAGSTTAKPDIVAAVACAVKHMARPGAVEGY
jgi:hypothetical protein